MKVKDLLVIDIDVYDNVVEELGIAFCGAMELTDEGKEKFADVLEYDIEINEDYGVAIVDIDYDDWEDRLKKAKRLFIRLLAIVRKRIIIDGLSRCKGDESMWHVVRGDIDGLDFTKCDSYDVAVMVMLEQMISKIEVHGIYGDNFEVDRYSAYVSTNEGVYNWRIINTTTEIK